ncbi:amino-acid N-acetyltransferase [Thiomicrorhabdus sediminis]|uniref:Amino-acid acetyltransferase n=1 Tax=Thiomicrorhabdus sediminis TaxID=2580412 RepID=A0A4P9K6H6_9GAMM|nr:amino-acid N-acetyltransferase [Thiomicrorhabdus sediminis]QCU90609.1 amino-acid N-acetyltransferase [Thiomicrorhabdus sediminis]
MQQSELDFINTLRQSTRYIEQHRGKTCVIYIPGEFMAEKQSVAQLCQDIGLLHNLGLKLVLAMGANQQLNEAFAAENFAEIYHQQFRITTTEMIPCFQKTIGLLRSQFEASFSQANSHQPNPPTLVSGNWVVAQPKGVVEGIDFQHTGKLRKIQHKAISDCLESGQVALLTPIAYSLTGEVFNLNTLEQACQIAATIEADKLMIYGSESQLKGLAKQMSLPQLKQLKADNIEQQQLIEQISVLQNKVKRIHLIAQIDPSALLLELFTRDGVGSMIFSDRYHQLRAAQIDDVCGILSLIEPLEQSGVLVKRSRERLELEIENFSVIQRDDLIIGCAALYASGNDMAELACLAVSKEYQGQELGFELLKHLEQQAKQLGYKTLFLLTTHTHHWFIEHGFVLGDISMLPDEKQSLYNYQRQSKVLVKPLS